ncbi:fructose-bisphosphate aldolase [Algimonas arctica]|uniref:Probable fructose-bisphosphate aldolase class 1 n=1 Tax=Algimonas arctica TaxID=1479486 RepID=A0A8J3CP63_9PROT|nr:class I fructose-bisphosphate aldolase [Algimonas arctica]GHA85953.1 fructose-bisphosphate aldolase [Algimonas arctica]
MSKMDDMVAVANAMVTPGKGILAADESTGTIGKRFASIGTENLETNRRDWRDMLFRTRPAMDDHISGVILYDETLRQSAADGTSMVDLIKATGAIPGIKVDMGITPLAGRPGETITQGLDGLRERLAEYYELGARFAKWRAVIEISHPDVAVGRTPTEGGIKANTHALGRYAALCQEAGIVPIVEPEVLMGGAHSVERCHEVTERALNSLFTELYEQGVALEATILKPNMVVAGKQCAQQPTREEIATRTIKVLKDTVPSAVPGIAFLSGGQENEEATRNLDMMNKIGGFPWKLTYSYGRALQQSALFAWQGKAANYDAAQTAFAHRAKMNGLASKGQWSPEVDAEVDA